MRPERGAARASTTRANAQNQKSRQEGYQSDARRLRFGARLIRSAVNAADLIERDASPAAVELALRELATMAEGWRP